MKPYPAALGLVACLAAPAALAHDEHAMHGFPQAVKARMTLMESVGRNMKVLGGMAKGETAFDAARANAAAAALAEEAGAIAAAFAPRETHPESEATPRIWDDWDGFMARTETLRRAAGGAAGKLESPEALNAAMRDLGGACKACHKDYREKKN
ncbi:cytochrome C [Maritimibacter sp. 55A14]|uniref:c-type cytochrome n=1 Tax=Maritimibacter sp. 55A14 TaxID=2174844 RepID=UPI000D622C84|nr:cytochrome c [Maritimibacter sp. 55A14]PWE28391.1 cytochrome C [Maritimibacter sp. 55A14]